MKKFEIKNWHLILLIWIILLLSRFGLFANAAALLFSYTGLLFTETHTAANVLEFPLIDVLLGFLIFITLPGLIFYLRKKSNILNLKIDFSSTILIILLYVFLFAPFLTDKNPDFQKDIGVTKLLPPFSSVKVLHLRINSTGEPSKIENFKKLENKAVKKSFDESLIFADSVKAGSTIIYYQRGIQHNINRNEVVEKKLKPLVTSRFYLLGSDEFGRDIYTRLVYSARISLLVGLGSVIISLLLGLGLGFMSGLLSGWVDLSLNRITEMFLAFPIIFLIILILALFGNSLMAVIIVLGFSGWMSLFKIVRGEVISIKNKDYFISAQMIGLSKKQLLFKEVLPVILSSVVVNAVFQFGNVILAEAALSYLGLGTGSNYPSWGAMIEAGQEYLTKAWWMIFFPGIILILTLMTANSAGRKLNKFYNPRIN